MVAESRIPKILPGFLVVESVRCGRVCRCQRGEPHYRVRRYWRDGPGSPRHAHVRMADYAATLAATEAHRRGARHWHEATVMFREYMRASRAEFAGRESVQAGGSVRVEAISLDGLKRRKSNQRSSGSGLAPATCEPANATSLGSSQVKFGT